MIRFDRDRYHAEGELIMDLTIFIKAQDNAPGGYEDALSGVKNGLWQHDGIRYIFPVLRIPSLVTDSEGVLYSFEDHEEARAYIMEPTLGMRLIEICYALLRQGGEITVLMPSEADREHLWSCMTLFYCVMPRYTVFKEVINKFFSGELHRLTSEIIKKKQGQIMRCVIASVGDTEYTAFVEPEEHTLKVFRNTEPILTAQPRAALISAGYNGRQLVYTVEGGGGIYVSDLEMTSVNRISCPCKNIIVVKLLTGSDRLALLLCNTEYEVWDYIAGELVYKTDELHLHTVCDLIISADGSGRAAGFNRDHSDEETVFTLAELFRADLTGQTLRPVSTVKFSMYENFYGSFAVYDSSTNGSHIPVFHFRKDENRAKAVTENYLLYVPVSGSHTLMISDAAGKLFRVMRFPEELDSVNSCFCYNEETDIVTVANKGVVRRFCADTADTEKIDLVNATYVDHNYYRQPGLQESIEKLMDELFRESPGRETE